MPRLTLSKWWHLDLLFLAMGLAFALLFWSAFFLTLGGSRAILGTGSMILAICIASRAGISAAVLPSPWRRALAFGLGTAPFWIVTHWFVTDMSGSGAIPLFFYFCAYPAAFCWLLARVRRRRAWPLHVVVPLLWVTLEIVRGEWCFDGYPWYLAGHAWGFFGGWNIGSVFGVYGMSFMLTFVAGCCMDIITMPVPTEASGKYRRHWKLVAFLFGIPMGVAACGWLLSPATLGTRNIRLAVVQTNLPQDNKLVWPITDRVESAKRWNTLTAKAAEGTDGVKPALVIWPETMFPGGPLNPAAVAAEEKANLAYQLPDGSRVKSTWFVDEFLATQKALGVPVMIGALASENLRFETTAEGRVKSRADTKYNAAFLVRNGVVEETRYDKIDLMPFGEYIPLAWRWPVIQDKIVALGAAGMSFDLKFGTRRTVFDIDGVRLVAPICFEGSYSRACRRLVVDGGTRRADLMVNMTNDGWFGNGWRGDWGRRMHLLCCRWRCVELGTPMVRAANTGVSCVIDALGGVTRDTLDGDLRSERQEGIMTADVPLPADGTGVTVYARWGHWIEWLIPLATLVMLVVSRVSDNQRRAA